MSIFFKYIDMHLEVDTEIVPGKLTIIDGDNDDNFPIRYAMDFVSENDKKEFMNLLISVLH